jgi:hypothetical protein
MGDLEGPFDTHEEAMQAGRRMLSEAITNRRAMAEISRTIHMRNNLKPNQAVCEGGGPTLVSNIDDVDCVLCLRLLVKDAVLYGRERRAKRWR